MKNIKLFVLLMLFNISAFGRNFSQIDCQPIDTGGRTVKTIFERTSGKTAYSQFEFLRKTNQIDLKADELGLIRYEKIEALVNKLSWNSGRAECNDYQNAKTSVVCTKTFSFNSENINSTACAYVREQNSYSDDCR